MGRLVELQNSGGVAAYYWQAYCEWRAAYGMRDDCMTELVAAIRAELANMVSNTADADRLRNLIELIETEIAAGTGARGDEAA